MKVIQTQERSPISMRRSPSPSERSGRSFDNAVQAPNPRHSRDRYEKSAFLDDNRDDGSFRPLVDEGTLLRQQPPDAVFRQFKAVSLVSYEMAHDPHLDSGTSYGIGPTMSYNHSGGTIPLYPPARYGVPPPTYSPYPQHALFHGYPQYPWGVLQPVEYVSNIQPSDVLSGRGGATNSHSGNRAFRTLIKKYKDHYLRAKKKDKPAVAAKIVQRIREKDGRFLKRVDKVGSGQVLWVDIGDEKAKEKTCQALREGAPEFKRRRKSLSTSQESTEKGESGSVEPSPISRPSSRSWDDKESRLLSNTTNIARTVINPSARSQDFFPAVDRFIRPIPVMVLGRASPEEISIEQLRPDERELYMQDFIPPGPCIVSHGKNYSSPTPASHFHLMSRASKEEGCSPLLVANV